MSMQITKVWWDGNKLVAEPINESEVYKPEPVTEWLTCPKCAHKAPYTPIKAKTLAEEAERITKQARAALSHPNPESGPEASADAEIASHAKRLALELECLLLSCGDTAAVTKWWDSAHEALEKYRAAIDRLYPPEHPTFMGEPVVGKGGAL